MERLKDSRTIAAKRGVRTAAVTTDRKLIIATIALLDSGESNTAIHKAAGRGQPVTQDISLSARGDKVVCSINGSIAASYDKTTLVGSGKLTSTNGYCGLRFRA